MHVDKAIGSYSEIALGEKDPKVAVSRLVQQIEARLALHEELTISALILSGAHPAYRVSWAADINRLRNMLIRTKARLANLRSSAA